VKSWTLQHTIVLGARASVSTHFNQDAGNCQAATRLDVLAPWTENIATLRSEEKTIRIPAFSLGMAISCVATPLAAGPAPPAVVYLNGPKSLSALQRANPGHHARAERIIAAANELCQLGLPESYFARFEAREISCADMILKTSNPPKKELSFTLDHIRYVALVAITDLAPKRVPLR
jgi:hypothetical protein